MAEQIDEIQGFRVGDPPVERPHKAGQSLDVGGVRRAVVAFRRNVRVGTDVNAGDLVHEDAPAEFFVFSKPLERQVPETVLLAQDACAAVQLPPFDGLAGVAQLFAQVPGEILDPGEGIQPQSHALGLRLFLEALLLGLARFSGNVVRQHDAVFALHLRCGIRQIAGEAAGIQSAHLRGAVRVVHQDELIRADDVDLETQHAPPGLVQREKQLAAVSAKHVQGMLDLKVVQMVAVYENVLRHVPKLHVVRLIGQRVGPCFFFGRRSQIRFEPFDPIGKDGKNSRPEYEDEDLPPIAMLMSQRRFLLVCVCTDSYYIIKSAEYAILRG